MITNSNNNSNSSATKKKATTTTGTSNSNNNSNNNNNNNNNNNTVFPNRLPGRTKNGEGGGGRSTSTSSATTSRFRDLEIGEATPLLLHREQSMNVANISTATTTTTTTNNNNGAIDVLSKSTSIQVEENTSSSSSSGEPITLALLLETIVAAVASVVVLTSIVSLLLVAGIQSPTVYVTGLLGIIVSPYVAIQQRKITETLALREINKQMDVEVTTMQSSNVQLTNQINDMKNSILSLQSIQETLDAIGSQQVLTIENLEQQVVQAETIVNQMTSNYKTELIQIIITVLLAIDTDHNMNLSDIEITNLLKQLQTIPDIQLNDIQFRNLIINKYKRQASSLLDITKQIITTSDNDPSNDDPNALFTVVSHSEPPTPTTTTTTTTTPTPTAATTSSAPAAPAAASAPSGTTSEATLPPV